MVLGYNLNTEMLIKSAKYIISSPDYKKSPKPDIPEFAFFGRSNVGKSSLINMLCNQKNLARISGSPGKTQLINHFEVTASPHAPILQGEGTVLRWYLVDLPGYGFAKVSQRQRKNWEKMINDYIRKRENLLSLFLLIDSRHPPQKNDIDFINQLGGWKVPFCLVFTKTDKETQKTVSKNVNEFLNTMQETWYELPPHFVTSAVKKHGREKMLKFIESLIVEHAKR
jgi:GTP-binding protein